MTDLDKLELDIAGKILAATMAAQMQINAGPVGPATTEALVLDALEAAKILVANRRGS